GLGRLDIDLERAQIAVVDADDPRADVEGDRKLARVVNLDERVEPVPRRVIVQYLQLRRPQRRDDEQNRVGAGNLRLEQLVFRDDEVLAEQRQADRGPDRREVLERAVEKCRLGKD